MTEISINLPEWLWIALAVILVVNTGLQVWITFLKRELIKLNNEVLQLKTRKIKL